MIRLLLAFTAMLASGRPAGAHGALPGIGNFYNGMLHPLLVPAQVLVLVATALIIGQHIPKSSRVALPTFAVSLAGGLLLPVAAIPSFPVPATLVLALAAGVIVALSLDLGPYGTAALSAMLGLSVGVASGRDALADGLPWQSLAGTLLGAIVFVTILAGLCAVLTRPWQKIGMRVLGSWIAASAFLVLALSLVETESG